MLWPCRSFALCAVSRRRHFKDTFLTSSLTRNGANRERLANFPYQPHAVALFRLSATVNRMRMALWPFAKSEALRRATSG